MGRAPLGAAVTQLPHPTQDSPQVESQTLGPEALGNQGLAALAPPPIFRRLGSSGLLAPPDIEILRTRGWRRSTVPAKANVESVGGLCILATGLMARYRLTRNGDRQSIGLIVPGDLCDYSLITGQHPRSRLTPLTKSTLLELSTAEAVAMLEASPNIVAAILEQMAVDHAVTEELLFSLARRNALERTAHLLSELEFRLRRIGLSSNGRFRLELTQAELGHLLGLTSVHVNRTMQELRRRHLLMTKGTMMELMDMTALHSLADFTPDYLNGSVAAIPAPNAGAPGH